MDTRAHFVFPIINQLRGKYKQKLRPNRRKKIREYRNVCRKKVEAEEKSKMLQVLKKHNICLGKEENTIKQVNKFKSFGKRRGVKGKIS